MVGYIMALHEENQLSFLILLWRQHPPMLILIELSNKYVILFAESNIWLYSLHEESELSFLLLLLLLLLLRQASTHVPAKRHHHLTSPLQNTM